MGGGGKLGRKVGIYLPGLVCEGYTCLNDGCPLSHPHMSYYTLRWSMGALGLFLRDARGGLQKSRSVG